MFATTEIPKKKKQEKQQSEMIGYYLKSRWYQSTTNSCGRKHEITGCVIKGFVVVVPVEKTSQTYYSTNSCSCSCYCSSPPGSRSFPWSCSSFCCCCSSSLSSSASFLVRLLRLRLVVLVLLLLLPLLWLAHKSFTAWCCLQCNRVIQPHGIPVFRILGFTDSANSANF